MSDPLSLLRLFVKNKKEFYEAEDKIVFGDVAYPKNVKTNYIIYGTNKDETHKEYYTLECLVFLIKNRDLAHPLYVKNAGTRNISVVSRPDRRDVIRYLDGEIDTHPSIDKEAIEISKLQPYTKSSAAPPGLASTLPSSLSGLLSSSTASSVLNASSKRPMPRDDFLEPKDLMSGGDSSSSSAKIAKLSGDASKQSIDLATGQVGTQSASASSSSQQIPTTSQAIIDRISKKFDTTAASSSRPITENITQLSDELTMEKIASIKAKKKAQQRRQVGDLDDDLLNSQSTSKLNNLTNKFTSSGDDQSTTNYLHLSSIDSADDGDAIMREILQRERVCRTRFSILQSTGREFAKDINAFLQLIKLKEEGGVENSQQTMGGIGLSQNGTRPLNASNLPNSGNQMQQMAGGNMPGQKARLGYNRFDQERYAAKDDTGGFSIDTKLTYQPNAGAISLTPNPNMPPANEPNKLANGSQPTQNSPYSQLSQLKPSATQPASQFNSKAIAQATMSPQMPQRKTNAKPIIIIPAARTSVITMMNAVDILQDLKFITAEDKKKQMSDPNAFKTEEIIIRKREGKRPLTFKVIDNPAKLAPDDWSRVVAVFAQGQQWQFKDWMLGEGNPAEIFNKVKGFHLKLSGTQLDPNITKWAVSVIELDQHKRHLDKARLLGLWDELDKFMAKYKPYLC